MVIEISGIALSVFGFWLALRLSSRTDETTKIETRELRSLSLMILRGLHESGLVAIEFDNNGNPVKLLLETKRRGGRKKKLIEPRTASHPQRTPVTEKEITDAIEYFASTEYIHEGCGGRIENPNANTVRCSKCNRGCRRWALYCSEDGTFVYKFLTRSERRMYDELDRIADRVMEEEDRKEEERRERKARRGKRRKSLQLGDL